MQERLTIVQPEQLGRQLAAAIRSVCSAPVRLAYDDLPRTTARLACGDFEPVRDTLRNAPPAAALPVTLARYVRWSGDLRTAAANWANVHVAIDALADDPSEIELRNITFTELAATATDLGDARLAARLHSLARAESDITRTADHRDSTTRTIDDSDDATRLIDSVVFDRIGIDPDAARGRLTLRPRTDAWPLLDARHIRFGDAGIRIAISHDRDDVIVRVAQDSGSIPITVLLEPIVGAVNRVEVDGADAHLNTRPVDGGFIVPVQLVLDAERTLVLRGTD